jgi:hypothetical protein
MGRPSVSGGGGGGSSGSSSYGSGGGSGGSSYSFASSSPSVMTTRMGETVHQGRSTASSNFATNHHPAPVVPLPMPSPRLQAVYISNLLDRPDAQESCTAMKYLTETRGLTRQTLRKYGVGLGAYNFRRNDAVSTGMMVRSTNSTTNNHLQYVRADCITFPWIMRASEVHEQEVLRGSSFEGGRGLSWNSKTNKEKDKNTTKMENVPKDEKTPEDMEQDLEEKHDSSNNENDEDNDDDDHEEEDRFVLRRIKARSLEQKSWQRLDPPGGGWGLFGWHTVPQDAKEIVLTEGEYDAMAVYQATGRPAVSLPNGCRSLPVEVLPMLERFETIYLWMDSDVPGREGAEQSAKKIGVNRCLLVQPEPSVDGVPPPKDANEALLRGMDLDEMIMKASVLPHERILTFRELRGQVLHEMLNPQEYAGVPVPSLPKFTEIIKGFRRGELTVLTGPTGSGEYMAGRPCVQEEYNLNVGKRFM